MLIFLGYDRIDICLAGETITVGRQSLEWHLGKTLLEIIEQKKVQKIYVVNGPGSFTNIRIGSLVINTIASLPNTDLKLHNLTSLQFYQYFVDQGRLATKGYIFIGQRKKCRLYDFSSQSHTLVSIPEKDLADTFVENISERDHLNSTVSFSLDDEETLTMNFGDIKKTAHLADIGFSAVDHITADYMIEPNIHK